MLTLNTPITLGSLAYTRLVGGVKGEWDLRVPKLEVTIALAREQAGKTVIATREKDGETTRVLAPPIVATLTIQDASPPDPSLATVWQKLHELTEAIEAVIVANALLASHVYQAGEEEAALTCTFAPSVEPGRIEEKEKKPKSEEAPLAPDETRPGKKE